MDVLMSDLPRIPNNDGMKQPRHPCYDGIYCKKCGVNIKLLDNFQSIVYNQENNILYCEECKPRKGSKYNKPYRRFWKKEDVQFSKLKRKGYTTKWRQK
jgi:hypothetical protein